MSRAHECATCCVHFSLQLIRRIRSPVESIVALHYGDKTWLYLGCFTSGSAILPSSVGPGNGFARIVSETSYHQFALAVRDSDTYVISVWRSLLISLVSNTVCRGDDASGRHDGRWNLLSIGGRRSVRLTRPIGANLSRSPPAPVRANTPSLKFSNLCEKNVAGRYMWHCRHLKQRASEEGIYDVVAPSFFLRRNLTRRDTYLLDWY